MTELLITPNYDKKTAKFKGTVAAGETVRVKIVNARDIDIYSLRLRVMEFNGRTLALFERTFPVEEDGAEINWVNDGEHLTCMLDLNTVEMQTAVCGMCERELLVVLDDPENDILHFKSICAFQGWPKRKGGDIPYELGEYPDIVENLKIRVNEAEKSIANHVDKADGIVAQANNVKNAAVKAELAARQAAAYADTAKEEAARQAQSAAKSADNLQVAVEEAGRHKNAAQEAQSAAESAKNKAVAAKNAAEDARDEAGKIAESTAMELVESVKITAEDAQRKANTLMGGDNNKSARSIAAEEVAKLVEGAPEALDTLKEVADWIAKDETGSQAIVNQVAGLTDEVAKKANINDVLSLKEPQNFSDDEKEIASINGGYRYRLYAPEAEVETVGDTEYLKYSVKDYAINIILLDTAKPVRIYLPAPVDATRRCRDFIVKLKVTSETIPAVEFVKSDADESIAFESSDDDWATIEAGINYFTFTETERAA